MTRNVRRYLVVGMLVGAAQVAGCTSTSTSEGPPQPASAPDFDEHVSFALDDGDREANLLERSEAAAACGIDIYFHPNNGAHGGWIESWRLCYQGGNQYQICTGGYAPVRYWNESSCGGTVHDYYPQGWHGWAQTAGGCC